MEPRFGHDFSGVRIHTDASSATAARALNAQAFTAGDHVFFGTGQSATGRAGQRLLAHELAHVTQQRAGPVSGVPGPGGLRVSEPGDAFEHAADRQVEAVMTGRGAGRPNLATPAAPAARGAPVIQRFLAGDFGHGGVEEDALHEAGFSDEEKHETYYGNWLRDYSQQLSTTGADDSDWFEIIQVLAAGEFGRTPTREELGRYLPSEHMDNPEGGDSAENPSYFDPKSKSGVGAKAQQAQRVSTLSKAQRAWLEDTQAKFSQGATGNRVDDASRDAIERRSHRSALPDYIERGKVHAMRQIEQAAALGRNREGFAALGNGLHAVEDYFAHSNFVEVALDLLVHDKKYGHAVGAHNASYAASQKYPGVKWDDLGWLNGERRIVTGTSAPGGSKTVGTWEVIKTELRSGELRKNFLKGSVILGWKSGNAAGTQAAQTIGAGIGAAGGAIGGAVGGLFVGAGRGAAEGWRKARHWWAKPFAAIGGLFKGAVTGVGHGFMAGGRAGARVGGKAGDVALGHVLGPAFGAVSAVRSGSTMAALILAASIAAAPFEPMIEAIAHKEMASGTKQTYTGKEKTKGFTHSQIAKDDPDHPLHAAAAYLAHYVDEKIGEKMIQVWGGHAKVEEAMALVDLYVAHPAKSKWWPELLAAFVNKPKEPPADTGPGG